MNIVKRCAAIAVLLISVLALSGGNAAQADAAKSNDLIQDICAINNPNVNLYVVASATPRAYLANPNPIQNSNGVWVQHQHISDTCRYQNYLPSPLGILCQVFDHHNNPPSGDGWHGQGWYGC